MSLTVSNLPLYWRFESELTANDEIPQLLDFTFDIDSNLDLLIEPRTDQLLSTLSSIYQSEANIGYLQEGTNLGSTYGNEYIDFLLNHLPKSSASKLVDVGCGGCLLLEKIRSCGLDVIGVDPSPIAIRAASERGIHLIPSMLTTGLFEAASIDYFTQMDVLEHAFNPVELLSIQRDALTDQGLIFINVPNCEKSIELGDISMAIHQHVNMFSRHSLAKVVEAAGLHVEVLTTSNYGSAIYCIAGKHKTTTTISSAHFQHLALDWHQFLTKADSRIALFAKKFSSFLQDDNGFFVFQRFLPYLCAANFPIQGRFFDNNTLWHSKYLDGVPSRIENSQDFLLNPTKNLFVFSHSFAAEIIDSLKSANPTACFISQMDFFRA